MQWISQQHLLKTTKRLQGRILDAFLSLYISKLLYRNMLSYDFLKNCLAWIYLNTLQLIRVVLKFLQFCVIYILNCLLFHAGNYKFASNTAIRGGWSLLQLEPYIFYSSSTRKLHTWHCDSDLVIIDWAVQRSPLHQQYTFKWYWSQRT